MSNMQLWDSAFATDPTHTKGFKRSGGFSGTAIKPYWLIKRATETFGPVGIGWGWEELENQLVAGVWCSQVRLWYYHPFGDLAGQRGQLEQWGQTVMTGTNKNGEFVDEEAPKKAVTDAVTKCLSYLGFGGDVHMGLFDDSKYVEERRREEGSNYYGTAKARNDKFKEVLEAINYCQTDAELDAVKARYKVDFNQLRTENSDFFDSLVASSSARREAIREAVELDDQMDHAIGKDA